MKKEDITYHKNMENSYMILTNPRPDLMESYFGQSVLHNQIRGVLPCSRRFIDGKQEIWMEITDKLTVEQLYTVREFCCEELRSFLTQLVQALSEAEKYLLDGNRFCFDPAFVYWDMEKKHLGIPFDFEEESEEGLASLGEFLLEHTSHEDEEAVKLAYAFYELIQGGGFPVNKLKKYLGKPMMGDGVEGERLEKRGKEPEEFQVAYTKDSLDPTPGKPQDPEEDLPLQENSGWNSRSSLGLVGVILSLLMCIGFLLIRRVYDLEDREILIWMGLSIGMFCLGIVVFVSGMVLRGREGKEKRRDGGTGQSQCYKESEAFKRTDQTEYEPESFEEDFPSKEDSYGEGKTIYIGRSQLHRKHLLIPAGGRRRDAKEIKLEQYPFLIGKERGSVSYELKDRSVSRIHARFLKENDEIYLEDLDSTNGTFVNDLPLSIHEKIRLKVGDYISFGRVEFEFH